MTRCIFRLATLPLAFGFLLLAAGVASARLQPSTSPSDAPPSVPMTEAVPAPSTAPDCCAPPPCCYNPCIKYRERGLKKRCYGCQTQQIVLKVQDPCQCHCVVEVPVCIPACCQGPPKVCGRCGVFCRGVVDYEWCCGFQVRVTLTKHGDVIATSIYR